jgi:hypothetical protein
MKSNGQQNSPVKQNIPAIDVPVTTLLAIIAV